MFSFSLPYPRHFASAGITFFFSLSYLLLPGSWGMTLAFSLSYPLLSDFWGYHGFLRSLIPAAARLLGVSWFPSHSHTLAILLLRVSHSFFRSHTRCCPASGGIMVFFVLPYPRLFVSAGIIFFFCSHTRYCMSSAGITFFFSLSYPLLPGSWGYHNLFLNFIPTISDNIYTIRYLPQITLTLNERFRLYNSRNTRQ